MSSGSSSAGGSIGQSAGSKKGFIQLSTVMLTGLLAPEVDELLYDAIGSVPIMQMFLGQTLILFSDLFLDFYLGLWGSPIRAYAYRTSIPSVNGMFNHRCTI